MPINIVLLNTKTEMSRSVCYEKTIIDHEAEMFF